MEKQHSRDLLEFVQVVEFRLAYLKEHSCGLTPEQLDSSKQELTRLLNKFKKIRSIRGTPIESISTVRGMTLKIGDKFHIAGDTISVYTAVLFPDTVTIRGESSNPAQGKPWTCEVYIESAFKVKKVKEKKTTPKKLKHITLVKEGEYFAIKTNNTIFKAIKVKKGKVTGTNELKSKNAPKSIKTEMFGLILKTKKEYKKQHKAEKK